MKVFTKPLLAVLVFCIMQALASLPLVLIAGIKSENDYAQHPTLLALTLIVSGLLTVAVLRAMRMIKPKTFNVADIKWKKAPLALVGAILGIIATDLMSEMLTLTDLMKAEFHELSHNLWGILAICIVGPIVEELVFREGIIGHMVRHGSHRWTAIWFSAILFGIIHFNPAQIPFAIIMGVILGIIYVKTGNIVLTGIIHIFNNSLAVLEMNLLGNRPEEITYADLLGGNTVVYSYIVVCSVMSILFLRQFWNQYHREHHHRHGAHSSSSRQGAA